MFNPNLWNNLTNHILSFLSSVSILDVSKNSYDSIFSVTDRIDKRILWK